MDDEFDGARVLVTGARGFLGQTLVNDLMRALPPSAQVTEVHRRADVPPLPAPHRSVVADLKDTAAWRQAMLEADIVIWTATLRAHFAPWAAHVRESIAPVRAALDVLHGSRRLRRLIFASSISAVDHAPGDTQPISDTSLPAPRSPYGRAKLETERLLLASGLPVTVLRLPFLYGPHYAPGTFVATLRRNALSTGWGAVPWSGRLSLLYAGDVARVCLAVARRDRAQAADASPYVLGDGTVYDYDDLINRTSALLGVTRPAWRWPGIAHDIVKVMPMSAELRYWRHVGFDPHFFIVDARRFARAFGVRFTAIDDGLRGCFGRAPAGRLGSETSAS